MIFESRKAIAFLVALMVTMLPQVGRADLIMDLTPYLSAASIPNGFYAGGGPVALEDFEDGALGFGIVASVGSVLSAGGLRDSVDGDDGVIDGSGSGGKSWFSSAGSTGVTFTFSGPLPTAAGIVWTDGAGVTTFEAFGPGMVSLGSISGSIADGNFTGNTAEDRFFGARDLGGILAIRLSNSSGGIEMDHLQFGVAAVPEPSSCLLLAFSATLLAYRFRGKSPFAPSKVRANQNG